MKSLKGQLIAAIAMTLVAVITISSSTFAWFSMSGTVTATGMSVTAKNDSKFLVIGTNSAIATLQEDNATTATAVTASASLYPVAHTETAKASVGSFSWYTKTADSPAASESTSAATTVDVTAQGQSYVLKNTFYITTAAGSNSMSNLKVSSCTISKNAGGTNVEAVRVLVVADSTNSEEFSSQNTTGSVTLAGTVTSSAAVKVDVYVFYDGNYEAVYTNNAANLAGVAVELAFTVDDATT